MTAIDRLFRNMKEAVDLYSYCTKAKVVICSTDGARLDPSDPDDALGLDVNAAVATSYSRQLSRKMNRSITGRVERGQGVKNRSCFGYAIDRRPGETFRRQLIRHPVHGPVAREVLDRFLVGDLLLAQLATWVQEGCQPGQRWTDLGGPKLDPSGNVVKDGRGRPRRHKIIPTTPSTLRAWLEHPELRGTGVRDRLAPLDAWAIPEPFLSPIEWGQVQGLLSRSSRGRKCPKQNRQPIHPLAGMVLCGHCGRGLHLRTAQRSWGLLRDRFQCPNRGCVGHKYRIRHQLLHWAAEAVVRNHAQQAAKLLQPASKLEGPNTEQLLEIKALRGALAATTNETIAKQLRTEIARLENARQDEQLDAVADQPLVEFLADFLQDGWSWRSLPLEAALRRTIYERVGVELTVKNGEVLGLGPGEVELPDQWPILDDRQWLWPVKLSGRAPSLEDGVDEDQLLKRWEELTGEIVEPSKGDTFLSLGDMEVHLEARQLIRRRKKVTTVSR